MGARARVQAVIFLAIAAGAAGTAQAAPPPVRFAAAVAYPTGHNGSSSIEENGNAVGDFDGDGAPDVVVVGEWYGSGVTVMLNHGDGSFGPGSDLPVATGTNNVLATDVDHDGRDDIVAFTYSGVYVFKNLGNAAFSLVATYAVQQSPFQDSVAAGDLDGDGKIDLAVKTPSGIQALLGHGDGTFSLGPLSALSGSFPGEISAIALAKLNADSIPDLVATLAVTQEAVTLRGTGTGAFTPAGSGTTTFVPGSVVAADLTGDGFSDVAAFDEVSAPGSSGAVFATDGQGGMGAASTVDGGTSPVAATSGDFNSDGHPDVVVSDTSMGREVVLLGDGHGLVPGAAPGVGTSPQTPVVADFNRDGRPDIAVTSRCTATSDPNCLQVISNLG
jgi:hypothetical protein